MAKNPRRGKQKYSSVSLPMGILKRIDYLVDELGYWPGRGAFAREACLEKIKRETQHLKELREARSRGPKKGSAPDAEERSNPTDPKKQKEEK